LLKGLKPCCSLVAVAQTVWKWQAKDKKISFSKLEKKMNLVRKSFEKNIWNSLYFMIAPLPEQLKKK